MNGDWEEVCSLLTCVSEKAFWYIADTWAQNPDHLMKPAKQFRLVSKKYYDDSNTVFVQNSFTPTNEEIGDVPEGSKVAKIEYLRHLIPRVKEKDNELDETVTLDFRKQIFYFTPLFPEKPDPTYLPFFYPKILGFSISYIPCANGEPATTSVTTTTTTSTTELPIPNETSIQDNENHTITSPTNTPADKSKSKSKIKREKKLHTKQTTAGTNKPAVATLVMKARFFGQTYRNMLQKIGKEVLEKLDKWGIRNDSAEGYTKHAHYDVVIPRELYFSTYERLKKRHKHWAEDTVKDQDGTGEKGGLWRDTHGGLDPQKYVFEEIGIAAYLVALWEIERIENKTDKLQSFVDVGCGNGFLANLLIMEGHPGTGVDLRSRKIWAHFDKSVRDNLIEEAIIPEGKVYEDVDWVIANHSDELTPWIPFIASKNPSARFLVIPCCFYDFHCKFNKNDNRLGQYRLYLNYVESIARKCGFEVERDTLRIPSTKNVALMGRRRHTTDPNVLDTARAQLLAEAGYTEFTPRPKAQAYVPPKRIRPGCMPNPNPSSTSPSSSSDPHASPTTEVNENVN